jgi:phosphopantetheinyl transferase (holo-ACP synthase)
VVELMSTVNELRNTIADFFEVPESQIGPSFSLRSRSESIARAALDAAIRHRVGRVCRSVYSATTYGEIEAELFADESTAVSAPASRVDASASRSSVPRTTSTMVGGAVSCGIDIELVESMPSVDDYWEAAFYRTNFAPAEIAYCLRQVAPAVHLAARWCVKEALKKCDPTFYAEEMCRIELVADGSGAPYLVYGFDGKTRRLPHAVSLSHTPHTAVAVVMKVDASSPGAATVAAVPPPPPIRMSPSIQAPRPIWRLSLVSLLLSLAAFCLAAFALFRSL